MHRNSEKGPTFLLKIPERVDIETIKVALLLGVCPSEQFAGLAKINGLYTMAIKEYIL